MEGKRNNRREYSDSNAYTDTWPNYTYQNPYTYTVNRNYFNTDPFDYAQGKSYTYPGGKSERLRILEELILFEAYLQSKFDRSGKIKKEVVVTLKFF